MKLGQELCNLSSEREKKVEEVWNLMQEVLRRFAKKTGERGCNVFFDGVSEEAIEELIRLASEEDIELINWNSPKEPGHPGGNFEQIGIMVWDRSWYLSKYPFKVSLFSMLVSVEGDMVEVEIIDVEGKTISFQNNKKRWNTENLACEELDFSY